MNPIAQSWLKPETKKAGDLPGGEGWQWPRGPVAVSPAAPNFLKIVSEGMNGAFTTDCGVTWNYRVHPATR